MDKSRKATLFRNALCTLGLLSSPSAMYACPLCYASAGERAIQSFQSGILVLLPVPYLLFGIIAYMAYRRRNRYIDSPE